MFLPMKRIYSTNGLCVHSYAPGTPEQLHPSRVQRGNPNGIQDRLNLYQQIGDHQTEYMLHVFPWCLSLFDSQNVNGHPGCMSMWLSAAGLSVKVYSFAGQP